MMEQFNRFLADLKVAVEGQGLSFVGAADEPDYSKDAINLSFTIDKEPQIDQLIRHVRDNMANNYTGSYLDDLEGKFSLAVRKTHICSSPCWSVYFYFSHNWKLEETIQG